MLNSIKTSNIANSLSFQMPQSEAVEADSDLFAPQNMQANTDPVSNEKEEVEAYSEPKKKSAVEGPSIHFQVSPINKLSPPEPNDPHFFTPELTGTYQVGVKSFYADPEKKIVVDVHYPGVKSQSPVYRVLPQSPSKHPMNRDRIEDLKKKEFLENLWFRSQPKLESAKGKFPVVLFSHGMASNHFEYQHLVEDLASHGYCVMTISSPDSNAFSPFGQLDRESTDEEAIEAMEKQAKDLLFIIDQLRGGGFKEHIEKRHIGENIDIERIGVMGHSLGADAGLRACSKADHIRTAIDLDGGCLRHNHDPEPIKQPVLSIGAGNLGTYGENSPWPAKKEWEAWHSNEEKSSRLSELQIIENANHEDFSIQPLFNAKEKSWDVKNSEGSSSEGVLAMVSKRVVGWFNVHLKTLSMAD